MRSEVWRRLPHWAMSCLSCGGEGRLLFPLLQNPSPQPRIRHHDLFTTTTLRGPQCEAACTLHIRIHTYATDRNSSGWTSKVLCTHR